MTGYESFSDESRVWIYQSKRLFLDNEAESLRQSLKSFAENWVSHNRQLKAFADVYHNRFIILMVDESRAEASGCSIDASVAFLKKVEALFQTDLFDRLHFTLRVNGENLNLNRDEFIQWYASGKISDETLVFDNLVNNKKDFTEAWLKPLGKSWLKRMV